MAVPIVWDKISSHNGKTSLFLISKQLVLNSVHQVHVIR